MPPTPPTLCYWYCTLLVCRTSPKAPQPMHQRQPASCADTTSTPGQTWWHRRHKPPMLLCILCSVGARDYIHPSVNALSIQAHGREALVCEGGGQAGGMHHAPLHHALTPEQGTRAPVAPMQVLSPPTHAPTRMWQSDGCTVCSVSCSAAAAAMANALRTAHCVRRGSAPQRNEGERHA